MENTYSPGKLSNMQLELLKIYSMNLSEEEMLEIKRLLAKHFMRKAIEGADDVWDEKGFSNETMNAWLREK